MLNDIKWHKIHGLSKTVDDGLAIPTEFAIFSLIGGLIQGKEKVKS